MIKKLQWCCTLILLISAAIEAKQPQRIVALAPHIVESLFEIGAGDRIVATVDYADYPKQALDIPRIGGYYGIQIEKILELKADLIIVWKNGNRQEDITKMESLGLPLAYSTSGKIEDVANELVQFGQLTGLEEQGQKAAAAFNNKLTKLKQRYSDKQSIDTFYQLWSEPMRTVNKTTWIHQMLEVCGANNVFANADTGYPQIGIENVLVAKPELIIVPDEKSDRPQPKVNWQPWHVIPAVKNNAFISVNADLIHRFSSRMLLGLADMCEKVDKFRN